ncbi:hypothetical protein AMECASPLE_035042 [Ameca splendens]|uniref:Uncharacterized protein n=1 Tax=Ameca splendens TaxID=208324 RepID=A0ABV0ZS26_9TELE
MGGRRGTPWTGRQSIAGQYRHTQDKPPLTHSFTPKGNLEKPVNSHVFGLWEEENPERTHACTRRTCKLQKDPRPGVEPRIFLLQGNSATNRATVQPKHKYTGQKNKGNT